MNGGQCRYSSTPDHNLCTHAHSQEELDEWRERWHWRQMKRDIARKEQVFSYMEQLLEDYDHAESPIAVVSRPVLNRTSHLVNRPSLRGGSPIAVVTCCAAFTLSEFLLFIYIKHCILSVAAC